MIWKLLIKAFAVVLSTGAGILIAVIVVSPFIWYMNMTANDGPIFPPPLVALGFFGLPYAFLIFPVQLIVALYELFSGKSLGFLLLVIATLNGLLAGFLWSLVLKSSETDTIFVLSLVGVALIQSFVVFGSYWLVDKYALTILNLIQKSVQSRKEMPRTN